MEPTVQPYGHVCATCMAGTGSPNGKPKLRRTRLNVWLAWALSVGGPLLWRANYPKVHDRESPWMDNCHATVSAPRFTHFIGARGSDKEPGVGQSSAGVFKPACLEPHCRSEHLHQWLQPSKQPNVAPFGQRVHWWRNRSPKLGCDGGVTGQK